MPSYFPRAVFSKSAGLSANEELFQEDVKKDKDSAKAKAGEG
jgi:hypothetical protein